jgi:hypothetical protein
VQNQNQSKSRWLLLIDVVVGLVVPDVVLFATRSGNNNIAGFDILMNNKQAITSTSWAATMRLNKADKAPPCCNRASTVGPLT